MSADLWRVLDRHRKNPGFAGREEELKALTGLLGPRPAGVRLVTLTGPAGIGKTRLFAQWWEQLPPGGPAVVAGRAERTAPPFEVFSDALDGWLRQLPEPPLDEDGMVRLAGIFPALPGHRPASGGGRADAVFAAIRALLLRAAGPDGLVLFCDDMHWADPESLALLEFLCREPPAVPILIVLAYRSAQAGAGLTAVAETARRHGVLHALELGGLAETEADRLLPPGLDVPARRALYREGDGNPGLLRALAGAEPPAGYLGSAELRTGLPPVLTDAPAGDLSRLSREAWPTAHAAAVCGDPFDPAMAGWVAAAEPDQLRESLGELRRCGVLEPAPDGRLSFRDPVLRAGAYHASGSGWRRDAHARAVSWLERAGAGAEAQAQHLEHIAVTGDAVSARVLTEAARDTLSRSPGRAARWLERAAQLLRGEPAGEDRLALGRALTLSGRFAEAERVLLAVDLPEAGRWRAKVYRFLGRYSEAAHETRVRRPSAGVRAELLATAMECHGWQDATPADDLAREPSAGEAAVCSLLAAAWGRLDRRDGLARHTERATALVDRLGDEHLVPELETLRWLAEAEWRLGRPGDAARHLARGRRLASEFGQHFLRSRFSAGLGRLALAAGELDAAAYHTEEAMGCAEILASPALLVEAQVLRAGLGVATGDVETGVLYAQRAVEFASRLEDANLDLARRTLHQARTARAEPSAASHTLKLLSHREEQIALLVSEGRTNQQIARELDLSHKTVETYLGRIFKKLGISARTQVAHLVGVAGG
ncbi:ATP-binding protein [Amycolatopsis australiensis]|uniref:Regulatory protein, luxR family n=1 Tax=Amycolatopsis australiensis TaxID=546364 RepID=A0A1K1RMA3_9PSEU|nr:AAA family ATPase [Amycolatopsis australiensis]SFW72981.1 regulatory protein, luxR family [Amycolatopsis australiensis]